MDTVASLSKKLHNREITSVEVTQQYAKQVQSKDPVLNALISETEDHALQQAHEADMLLEKGEQNALTGIPVIVKDNMNVKGIRMTASSKMLDTYVSPYTATVVEHIASSPLLGKANLDSFAFGASTENSGYFVTKNPWDVSRVAGGSSGGSAASVAAGMAPFALGSDTGGSIRQPASFCGIVGLKPTYGRASRYGIAAMGSSLDCPGPLAQSVEDAALILNAIAGYDPLDSTSMPLPVPDYTQFGNIKGKKIGVPKEFFEGVMLEGLEKGVKEEVEKTIELLKSLGAIIQEVSIPHSIYSLPVYYIITPSEISANMARYDGIRYGHTTLEPKDLLDMYLASRESFEDEVKRRIFVGNYALSSGYYDAYYNKAMQVRALITQELEKVFTQVDVLVGPTAPTTAFKVGENTDDPLALYLADIYTVTANIAGIPALSIPCGLSNNLPVGFQIFAKQFGEQELFTVGKALEDALHFRETYQPSL